MSDPYEKEFTKALKKEGKNVSKALGRALDKKKKPAADSAWLKSEKERHEFDKGKAWAN